MNDKITIEKTTDLNDMDEKTIQNLLKKHYPDFLPVDLVMKPWLRDLIIAAYQEGYEQATYDNECA